LSIRDVNVRTARLKSKMAVTGAPRFEASGHTKGFRSLLQVLIISYNFPPDAEVGAKRVTRLCRYLPEFGISPIVLTIDGSLCPAPAFGGATGRRCAAS